VSVGPIVLTANAVTTDGADGLLGDAVVFEELGCRTACVATTILAATGNALQAFEPVSATLLAYQLDAGLAQGRPSGARLGALSGAAQVEQVTGWLERGAPEATVYAPILRAGTATLLDPETHEAARRLLFPAVRVLVARAADLPILLDGREARDLDEIRAAASALRAQGARAVVLAGLVLRGRVFDLLDDDGRVALFDAARLHVPHVAGLSGAYAAALAAHLARGAPLLQAAEAAQRYVGLRLARGR